VILRHTLEGRRSTPSGRTPGGITIMTEAQQMARRALQESMDLRDQGHSDD
jgi:hypothetical protein